MTKVVPPQEVERTRKQIDEYRRLQDLTSELVEVSVGLCDAQLSDRKAAAKEVAKKGASRKSSA